MSECISLKPMRGHTERRAAIVDVDCFDLLQKWSWHCQRVKRTYYAYRVSDGQMIYMHRFIMGLAKNDGKEVDHRDGDGLNNQRSNLRVCTLQENSWNKHRRKRGLSGLMGVSWDREAGKWRVRVHHKGKCLRLGRFASKAEAARVYDKAVSELRGEFAVINGFCHD